jgi:osmotically-inducible protein OsmY
VWVHPAGDFERRAVMGRTEAARCDAQIQVRPPRVDPAQVRRTIQEALERQASREARRIRVEVDDGVVTLYGDVHTYAERRAAVGAARGTEGVRRVDDRMYRARA